MKHFAASKKTLLVLSTALIALTAAYKIEEPAARGETLEYDDDAPGDSSAVSLRYRNDDYAAFSEIIDMLLFDEDPDPYADEGARYVRESSVMSLEWARRRILHCKYREQDSANRFLLEE